MRTLVDACVLVVVFVLYWCSRQRRQYLKKRIGALALSNVYRVARNVGYMLSKKTLFVQGHRIRLQPGSILFSLHYGVWELMPRTLDAMGYRVGIIVNRYTGDSMNMIARLADALLYRYRSVGRVLVFYKDETLKIVRFLKNGGIIGVLVDGDSLYAKHPLIVRLSRVSHAPLVPFAAYTKNGSGILHIGCDLDMLVKNQPMDYVWFYKSRPKGFIPKA
jgi:hypothetical protein